MTIKQENMFCGNMFKVGDRQVPHYRLVCVPNWYQNVKNNVYTGDANVALKIMDESETTLKYLHTSIKTRWSQAQVETFKSIWKKWLSAYTILKQEKLILWKKPVYGNSPINEIIKNTKVTMFDIPKESPSLFTSLVLDLCWYFKAYDDVVDTYLAPFLISFINYDGALVKTLKGVEYFAVHHQKNITLDDIFWLSEPNMIKLWRSLDVHWLLKNYVGSYLDELDLRKSYITGSAIPASYLEVLPQEFRDNFFKGQSTCDWFKMQETLYPKYHSVTENGIKVLKPGADIDIAIDDSLSEEEYEEEVLKHYSVIKKHYPNVQLEKLYKTSGSVNYSIYVEDPAAQPDFRIVELYQSSPAGIAQHHVPCVRACYTTHNTDKPMFYMAASALSVYTGEPAETFYFFVSQKSTPEDILLKYQKRGFKFSDKFQSFLDQYVKK